MFSLVLLGGGILADDSRHTCLYGAIGASLATVSALGLILGTDHLRKQGLSPAEVQAMIDQHNREVLKDLDGDLSRSFFIDHEGSILATAVAVAVVGPH